MLSTTILEPTGMQLTLRKSNFHSLILNVMWRQHLKKKKKRLIRYPPPPTYFDQEFPYKWAPKDNSSNAYKGDLESWKLICDIEIDERDVVKKNNVYYHAHDLYPHIIRDWSP